MNRDVSGKGKLFWKKTTKAEGGKGGNCWWIKARNGRMAVGRIIGKTFGRNVLI